MANKQLKLFVCEHEFGYIAESLEACLAFYDGAYDVRDWILEIDPDAEVTLTVEDNEEPQLPRNARCEPLKDSPGLTRVTATAREWIETTGEGELWSAYA